MRPPDLYVKALKLSPSECAGFGEVRKSQRGRQAEPYSNLTAFFIRRKSAHAREQQGGRARRKGPVKTARRRPSASQGERPQEKPNLPTSIAYPDF